jgi:hypothetical protein
VDTVAGLVVVRLVGVLKGRPLDGGRFKVVVVEATARSC